MRTRDKMATTVFRVVILCSLAAAMCVWAECDTNKNCTTGCDNGYHEQCQADKTCACLDHSCVSNIDCPRGNHIGCPPPEKHESVAFCFIGKCQCIRLPPAQ